MQFVIPRNQEYPQEAPHRKAVNLCRVSYGDPSSVGMTRLWLRLVNSITPPFLLRRTAVRLTHNMSNWNVDALLCASTTLQYLFLYSLFFSLFSFLFSLFSFLSLLKLKRIQHQSFQIIPFQSNFIRSCIDISSGSCVQNLPFFGRRKEFYCVISHQDSVRIFHFEFYF